MRRYADLMASIGEYKDSDGKKCKRLIKVGVLMRDSGTGGMSLKLDCVPIGRDWSGWIAVKNIIKDAE